MKVHRGHQQGEILLVDAFEFYLTLVFTGA